MEVSMKKILLAMVFAVTVPAWAGGSAPEVAGTDVSTNDVVAAPLDRSECLTACDEQYNECLGNAGGAGAECMCYNNLVACLRGCGIRRPFIQCPSD
jgi:hypothetical protein